MDVAWLQPLATVLAAALALTGAGLLVRQGRAAAHQRAEADRLTLDQRDAADRKEQWWSRTQWALELSFSDVDAERELAYEVLAQQGASTLADEEDLALLEAVAVLSYGEPVDGDPEQER